MNARALPITHPVALVAITVLIVNDHVLKAAFASWWTGKLSDVAGLVFFPLFLLGLFSLGRTTIRPWMSIAACASTAMVFTLVKVWPPANEVYRVGLGTLQWPVRSLWMLAHGHALPAIAKVGLAMDASDLIALPAVLVAYAVGRRNAPPDASAASPNVTSPNLTAREAAVG